jgi:drug/metabolite transporter (DMT)-like permease
MFNRIPLLVFQVGLVFAWSSAYLGAVLASETGSIVRVILWRFILVTLLFSPFLWKTLRRGVSWRWCAIQAVLGAVGMFGSVGLGIEAINLGLPAGTASLIAALQPLATAVLAGAVLGERVVRAQWIGLLIGVLGVGFSVGGLSDSSQYLGYICSFVSMICMMVATLIAKAKWGGSDLGAAIAMQTITTALLFLPIALYNGTVWPQLSLPFLGAVAWAIVFATLGGYGLYYVCLARSGAVRTTSLIYVTPGLTLVWAWVMFGQPMSAYTWVGLVLCLVGVYLARGERTAAPVLTAEKA